MAFMPRRPVGSVPPPISDITQPRRRARARRRCSKRSGVRHEGRRRPRSRRTHPPGCAACPHCALVQRQVAARWSSLRRPDAQLPSLCARTSHVRQLLCCVGPGCCGLRYMPSTAASPVGGRRHVAAATSHTVPLVLGQLPAGALLGTQRRATGALLGVRAAALLGVRAAAERTSHAKPAADGLSAWHRPPSVVA